MKKLAHNLIFLGLAYATVAIFYYPLTASMGDHRFTRMQDVMRGLEQNVFQIKIFNPSYRIDVDHINAELDERWLSDRFDPFEYREDYTSKWLLNEIITNSKYISSYWGLPPQIVERPDATSGYGFYLRGPDKTSESKGEDRDDLNSWDPESRIHHYRKLYRKKIIFDHSITLALSIFIFSAGKMLYNKKLSTRSRTEPRVRAPMD